MEHGVKEADEQLLVELWAKEPLEAEVGMWIYIFVYHNTAFWISRQIYGIFVNLQNPNNCNISIRICWPEKLELVNLKNVCFEDIK